jgi:MacB-like periplasmic core domain
MKWFRQLFSRRRLYGDLSEEIQEHLREKTEELVASGMSRKGAFAAARREFGNVNLIEEDSRAVWRWQSIEGFFTDVRYSLRMLRKNPGFTAVVVLTLALGIGATTAIYSVTYATLLAPLSYPKPEQLVMVWPRLQQRRVWGVSAGDFLDWKRQSSVFQDLNASTASGTSFNLSAAGRPEHIVAQQTTPGFYGMMGVRFLLGRSFLPEEGISGKITLSFSPTSFGNDSAQIATSLANNCG